MSCTDWYSPCVVYRYYSADGTPLYFGHTRNAEDRDRQHVRLSPWRGSAATRKVSEPMSRLEAMAEEARLIYEEQPIHNVAHKKSPKLTADPLMRLNYQRATA